MRFSIGGFQLGPRPEDGPLGLGIEAVRIEHGSLIVIAEQDDLAFHGQIDAFARIGPVADDVAEAINLGDILRCNVLEHRLEGLEVAVDVADEWLSDIPTLPWAWQRSSDSSTDGYYTLKFGRKLEFVVWMFGEHKPGQPFRARMTPKYNVLSCGGFMSFLLFLSFFVVEKIKKRRNRKAALSCASKFE